MLLGIFALTVFAAGPHPSSHASLWAVSISFTVAAALGIAWIWFLASTSSGSGGINELAGEHVNSIVGEVDDDTLVIRTGVFVQSVEFEGADTVLVSGLAWQEGNEDPTTESAYGIILPEADSATFTVHSDQSEGSTRRVGWAFSATLRQRFDYTRYPFDREDVWLRLWPSNLGRETLLLPDLPKYQILAGPALPGLDSDFEIEGWTVDQSGFSHRRNQYNTNFGVLEFIDQEAGQYKPELYFNVSIRREFLNPFISSVAPLMVVWAVLFGVLLVHKPEDNDFGDTMRVLTFGGGMFFIVLLSQRSLRTTLQADGIIYLEYFHLVTYLAIFGISINALMIWAGRGGPIIHYDDNLIPELAFWPLIAGTLLAATITSFA